ncbi:MAG: TatD family hydrolase, partial [Deltaproteobacteria bacterium]|nr:TatD family hydrolase [Deltaproteobacteria bacterium]
SERVTQPSQQRLQDVLRVTPLENILLETDFPVHKGDKGPGLKRYCQILNTLYLFVSRLRHVPMAELVQIIDRNGSLSTY